MPDNNNNNNEQLWEEIKSKSEECPSCGSKLYLFIRGCCLKCKKINLAGQATEPDEDEE